MSAVLLKAPTRSANEALVTKLEQFVEAAKAGRIAGLALAAVRWDGQTTTWYGPNGFDSAKLLGAVAYISHRIAQSIDDADDGDPLPEIPTG